MCVIMYKPKGFALPSIKDLRACFNHNRDGAGFMMPINNKVVIHKGFMTFKSFIKDLYETIRQNHIDVMNTPIVCHFRISTQGGVNQALCHPFAICDTYDEMRLLKHRCDMALVHNGIITLTSESAYYGGYWDGQNWHRGAPKKLNHNDTMKFIKDYLSLIAENDPKFTQNANKCMLIERLIGASKLAIMNGDGDVKLVGGFYNREGRYYSNLHAFPNEDKLSLNYLSDLENY